MELWVCTLSEARTRFNGISIATSIDASFPPLQRYLAQGSFKTSNRIWLLWWIDPWLFQNAFPSVHNLIFTRTDFSFFQRPALPGSLQKRQGSFSDPALWSMFWCLRLLPSSNLPSDFGDFMPWLGFPFVTFYLFEQALFRDIATASRLLKGIHYQRMEKEQPCEGKKSSLLSVWRKACSERRALSSQGRWGSSNSRTNSTYFYVLMLLSRRTPSTWPVKAQGSQLCITKLHLMASKTKSFTQFKLALRLWRLHALIGLPFRHFLSIWAGPLPRHSHCIQAFERNPLPTNGKRTTMWREKELFAQRVTQGVLRKTCTLLARALRIFKFEKQILRISTCSCCPLGELNPPGRSRLRAHSSASQNCIWWHPKPRALDQTAFILFKLEKLHLQLWA